ncbi:MAG: hypothetical protein WA324_06070 [Bryobacteraceae bacterium]
MKNNNRFQLRLGLLTLLPATLLLLTSAARATSLSGDTVTCGGTFSGLFCSPVTAVVGPLVEFTLGRGGVSPQSYLSLDFDATDLVITALSDTNWLTSMNTLTLSDTSSAFPSAALLSSTADIFGAGNVSLLGGVLSISLQGTEFMAGQTVDIGLTGSAISPTPEPAALGFMSAALIIAGVFRMRKRK